MTTPFTKLAFFIYSRDYSHTLAVPLVDDPHPHISHSFTMPDSLFPMASLAQRAAPGRGRAKVALEPGHLPLDWANLQRTEGPRLRGSPPGAPPPQYTRVPREEVKLHKSVDDAWTIINGKVYNITPYLNFHPGGVKELMKGAGTDSTTLFNKYHAWVNVESMLRNCWIGVVAN